MRNVLLRTSSRTILLIDQPSRTNRSARSSSSSGWEGRSPSAPKLSTEGTSPRPKTWCQMRFTATRAVSGLAGSAILRARSRRPLPTARDGDPRSLARAESIRRGTTGPTVFGLPRRKTRSSSGVPSVMAGARRGSGSRASTSRNDSSSAPDSSGRRLVEFQQAALDQPGEQGGPGLGVGPVGQGAVGHRRERFGHGAPISLGEGEGRIDRRVPEQADHRRGRGHGRRALIGEEGARRRRRIRRDRSRPAGPCRGGPASWCPRTRGRRVGPATSPGRTCASEGRRRSGSAGVGRRAGPGSSRIVR